MRGLAHIGPSGGGKTIRLRLISKVSILLAGLACAIVFVGCLSSTDIDMKRAKKLLADKKPSEAVALYEKISQKEKKDSDSALAALEAAKIYQYDLKKFDAAIRCYRIVIAKSSDATLRRDAQSKVAALLFYDLQEFSAAVNEYSRMLSLHHSLEEEIEWRSRIAKAYYYLGNYFQAGIEVDRLLKIAEGVDEEAVYQGYLLKANILVGAREHEEAAKVLDSMISQFAERARRDSIPLMLAVAYEEQRNFAKAIEVLTKVREYDPRKSFVDEKIRSLKERQSQQPGARGFRK